MSDKNDEKLFVGCGIGAVGCLAVLIVGAVSAFSMLFFFGFQQRGGVYDDLRGRLAVTQMNQLVPYIEMYKSQHGEYPESLTQIAETIPSNVPVTIYDSAQPPTETRRVFHYERVGDTNFILRSVGADGEAFTADDIVPDGFAAGASGLLLERPPMAPAAEALPPPETPAPSAPSSDNPR